MRTYVCNLQSRPRTLAFPPSLLPLSPFPLSRALFLSPTSLGHISPPHPHVEAGNQTPRLFQTHFNSLRGSSQKGHRMASWQVCDPFSLFLFLPSSSGKREIRSFFRSNNQPSDFIQPIIGTGDHTRDSVRGLFYIWLVLPFSILFSFRYLVIRS